MYSLVLTFFGCNTSPAVRLLRTSFIFLALVSFAPHRTLAVSPAPDGGYPHNNTAEGSGALFSLTTGINNTALGFQALFTNTIGRYNTATGSLALERNQSGSLNTANGYDALFSNTTGHDNTATGFQALFSNTGATTNDRSAGSFNTANGSGALFHNTTGSENTAMGSQALQQDTTGAGNTAIGSDALLSNTTGDFNTAVGWDALRNTNGQYNTAIGVSALDSAIGQENIAIGDTALAGGAQNNNNVAIGRVALVNAGRANFNIALGDGAGQNLGLGDYNIYIGSDGPTSGSTDVPAPESDTIRIGKSAIQTATFIAGIYGQRVDAASAVPVQIDSTGKLGTVLSSARFKQAIKPMDNSSDALLALEPVTFQYKPELDPKGVPQFGLVAEQVEKVAPQLVVHDKEGKPYTVRYEAVNAMLLNEFLKEHKKVAEQESTIAELKVTVAQQQKHIETLAAGLRKVSAAVELNKPSMQVVAENR